MNIAIAGYGIEGKANYHYYKTRGDITIVDERSTIDDLPDDVPAILGQGAFSQLKSFDLVIRSAGVAPYKIITDGKVWSGTNEFLAQCQTPIIGVTGTKGKGTTASLIHSILQAAGKNSLLVGNIGIPALAALDDANKADAIVYEMSSFQLWDAERSPDIAVVLMIEPDHLDVHRSFQEYIDAKKNIRRFQVVSDSCLYHPTNNYAYEIAATDIDNDCKQCGESINFANRYAIASENQVHAKDGYFCVQNRKICPLSALQLTGKFNVENACAAMSAVTELSADISDDAYEKGLQNFKGLDHRLKKAATVDGVTFYDDSIATTPGSAIAALEAFAEKKVIILGGSDKGADYTTLIQTCKSTQASVVAIGKTGPKIAALCEASAVPVAYLASSSMNVVVERAVKLAHGDGVVLLSPASASFDMFSSYADRGDQFIAAVKAFAEGSKDATTR